MTTTNMSLNEPSVGVTTGPTWATQTNSNWETIDTHDHTSGKGVQLTPSALNINSDLEFNQNSATELKNVIFDSSVTAATTNYSVYQSGGNLYWRNGSGTAVQITDGSGINTSGGSISNMTGNSQVQYSGVNKSYTFKFDSTLSDGIAKLVMSDIQLYFYNGGSATTRSVNLKYTGSGTGANTLTVPDETGTLLSTATSFAGVINIATSSSNAAINLKPNGTGHVVVGNGSATGKLTSNGAYDLVLDTNSGTNSGNITITDAANGNITFAPNGTGEIVIGSGSASGKMTSNGAYDLVLDTNSGSDSGSITITDGADGNIAITPNGTGEVDISKVDIDGGTLGGFTIDGSWTAASQTCADLGSVTTADINGGTIDGVEIGVSAAATDIRVDNLRINGNSITSTAANVDINITPDGTGEVNISKVDIDSGTVDGLSQLTVDNLKLDGNQIISTNTNGDIEITPNGSGKLGVGTASPDSNIEVSTSSGRSTVKITSEDGTGSDVLLERGTGGSGSRGIHNESGILKFSYSTNEFGSRTDQIQISASGSITTPNGEFNGTLGSSAVYPAGGTGNPISVAYLYDEKTNGTSGGTFGSGWKTRTLNTESDPDSIVSLSSNQFTLGAGTYLLVFSASAYDVVQHKTAIYDVTGTDYISPTGSSELTQSAYNDQTRSMGSCIVTPSSNNVYELRHYANTSKSTSGFGYPTSSGEVEIYATVTIFKLK